MVAAVCLLAICLPSYRARFPLPNLTVPNGWGVNIHFTDARPGEMQAIAGAGFRWVRMDFVWNRIEQTRGGYDFTSYDRLMTSLKRFGIRPLFILDYGNDLYQQGSPRSQEAREAFAKFVAASVTHFRHRGAIWEMWNEPNIGFWLPKPSADEYIALALQVGKTIRSVAPDERYVGPATSGFDWAFIQKCFDAGLLAYWDAVTVHPYRSQAPESVAADWARLRRMVKGKGSRDPLFSGEWGYSDVWSGMDEERQGWYAARQYLTDLQSGVPLSIWYDWKNDGPDPKEPEHHFGSVDQNLAPKAAYNAIKFFSHGLEGFRLWRTLPQSISGAHLLSFRKGRETKYVAWCEGRPATIALPGPAAYAVQAPTGAIRRSGPNLQVAPEPVLISAARSGSEILSPLPGGGVDGVGSPGA